MEAAGGQVEAASAPVAEGQARGRLLKLASDERLVARVRKGDDAAFTVLYERYQGRLLSFSRHMLGSQQEAEDVVQQTFINAYRDMVGSTKELQVRPWLYRIARNQSLSALRSRKQTAELSDEEPSLTGLSDQLHERSDLRELLGDLASLPDDQREALLLSELHDNSHADVAQIIGCDREKVKSLVFQARSSLMKSREARDVSCTEIQQQLSVLRGGALRRSVIRRHVKDCPACQAFRAEVKRQRAAMAIVLPVVPGALLKFGAASALAAGKAAVGAVTAGGGAAAGTAAAGATAGGVAVAGGAAAGGVAAGGGGAAAGGAASSAGLASTVAAKVGVSTAVVKGAATAAAVTTVAAGGAAGVKVEDSIRHDRKPAIEQRFERQNEQPAAPAAPTTPGATTDKRALREQRRAARRERQGGAPGQTDLPAGAVPPAGASPDLPGTGNANEPIPGQPGQRQQLTPGQRQQRADERRQRRETKRRQRADERRQKAGERKRKRAERRHKRKRPIRKRPPQTAPPEAGTPQLPRPPGEPQPPPPAP
jgi:RNA polymerase sigma factor (sigma-70 family)